MEDLQTIVNDIAKKYGSKDERGTVADYIPQLACVDPNQFGISIVTSEGQEYSAGDAEVPFSIQSISKVFALTLALQQEGAELWERVGREPSGDPFNSIVQLEHDHGVPRNPFINAGAIVVTDVLLTGSTSVEANARPLNFLRMVSEDENIDIDLAVAESETEHGYRNFALANFIRAYGNLNNEPADTLDVYFKNCSIAMSCQQLAHAGRFLVLDGQNGLTGDAITSSRTARRVNAMMLTCGHYDGSGEFAYRVGLPGKSGVGGGILCVAPGFASIACWSPGLNAIGNSHLATKALEELAARTGWSVFSNSIK